MRVPFNGSYPITQNFNDPCCRQSYAQFNMKGHNGIDYGLPTGTEVVAPHSGKVLEAGFSPTGYGNYVKLDNGTEGSVLAHLQSIVVGVGQQVSEGQVLGKSNNTGNSTGAHLHWGYYRNPRDRNNGFDGFIDQAPYLNQPKPPQGGTTMGPSSREDVDAFFRGFLGRTAGPGYEWAGQPLDVAMTGIRSSAEAAEYRKIILSEPDAPALKAEINRLNARIVELEANQGGDKYVKVTDLYVKK